MDTCTVGGYDWDEHIQHRTTCSRGQAVSRSQTCNGACPDDSPSNTTNAEGKIICDYNMECPFDMGYYMCGDICTHYKSPCICGDTTITYRHTNHYCCVPQDEDCSIG